MYKRQEYSEPDYRIAWIRENPQVSYLNYLKIKDPPYSDSDIAVIAKFRFSLTPAYYAVSRRGKLLGQYNGFAEIEEFEEDIARFLLGYVAISNKAGAK